MDSSENKTGRFESTMPPFFLHSRKTVARRPNPGLFCFSKSSVFGMPDMLICVRIVFGCFSAVLTELVAGAET